MLWFVERKSTLRLGPDTTGVTSKTNVQYNLFTLTEHQINKKSFFTNVFRTLKIKQVGSTPFTAFSYMSAISRL